MHLLLQTRFFALPTRQLPPLPAPGVYLLRNNANTTAWVHAWRNFFDKCKMHDQHCAYELVRKPGVVAESHPDDPRVHRAWDNRLWLAIFPPRSATLLAWEAGWCA
jgi:hypothetical protein